MNKQMKLVAWYVAALAIPCIIAVGCLYTLSIYPFGDRTIVIWDLQMTYTYFYEWFRNVLSGDASLFYSSAKSLGGNMLAGYAGICASPLNLLLLFFKGDNIVDFATFIIVLKFGLAGASSFFYIDRRFSLPRFYTLALSICYSMMLFMTTQSPNPMWMEVVIILPFVLLGVYLLVHKRKPAMLFISILFCIFCNWYNGYMVCLFTMLFYLYESYLYAPYAEKTRFRFLVNPGMFSATFTLAVVSSAIILLPTALGLLGGKGAVPGGLFSLDFRYFFPDVFRSLFLGVYEKEYLPQLYSGTLTLVCVIWFFINKRIGKREKVAAAVLLGFLVISTWFAPLDRIWLGFRDGNSFYCRFTFLISAVLITVAARSLTTLSPDSKRGLTIAGGIVLISAVLILVSGHYPSRRFFFATLFLAIALPLCIFYYSFHKNRNVRLLFGIALVTIASCEAFLSAEDVLRYRLTSDAAISHAHSYERQAEYYSEGQMQIDEVREQDGDATDAYRIGKTYNFLSPFVHVASNEGFIYGYSQIAQYDSAYDDQVQNFLHDVGYTPDFSCFTTYNDSILTTDSLLGVKYVADDEVPFGFKDVGLTQTQDGHLFYENPYALPLGYRVDSKTLEEIEFGNNPFENQNALFSALLGEKVEIFKEVETHVTKRSNKEAAWVAGIEDDSITYGFIVGSDHLGADLYVDGEYLYIYMYDWSHGMFPIRQSESSHDEDRIGNETGNEFEHGLSPSMQKPIAIKLETDASVNPLIDKEPLELRVYTLDEEAFAEAIEKLSSSTFDISVYEDGFIKGTYFSDGEGILFTSIPYDAGWEITANGEDIEFESAFGTFIALDLPAGTYEIEMRYTSRGFAMSAAITLASIVAFTVYAFWVARKRRAQEQSMAQSTKAS